jgi:hypothetical protein
MIGGNNSLKVNKEDHSSISDVYRVRVLYQWNCAFNYMKTKSFLLLRCKINTSNKLKSMKYVK